MIPPSSRSPPTQPLPSARVPVVDLDDIEGIADILIRHAAPLDAVLAHAGPG